MYACIYYSRFTTSAHVVNEFEKKTSPRQPSQKKIPLSLEQMTWLSSLIVRYAEDILRRKHCRPNKPSLSEKPITTIPNKIVRATAMPTCTKGVFDETENSPHLVGRPQSQPRGPHAALESLDKLRLYQAEVVAALETKE